MAASTAAAIHLTNTTVPADLTTTASVIAVPVLLVLKV
jgi:hypothetical protein